MQSAIEERRLLTVVFADLSGFTALAAKLDPEEVQEVASTCFEHLNQPIVRHGGTIHKYEGDLVIALFGYPSAHEDDPERAVQAALEMMALVPEINRVLTGKLNRPTSLGLHAGVNMGTVVVGEIGSRDKKEYTVMGDVVNITSRIKDLAGPDEILVSESVFRASRYLFDYEVRPAVAVKGVDEPLRTFRPLREKPNPDPKRGIKGLFAPILGRDQELGILRTALADLCRKQGGIFGIIGEAGLGKSRLLAELRSSIVQDRVPLTILEGVCFSSTETTVYSAIQSLLRRLIGIAENDDPNAIRDKISVQCQSLLPGEWDDVAPYLSYILAAGSADGRDEKIRHLDAPSLKMQIHISLRKLLLALARHQPLLVVIEDFHWIDNESCQFLDFFAAAAEPEPVLLVVCARPEKDKACFRLIDKWQKQLPSRYHEIVLAPLEPAHAAELIRHLLSVSGLSADTRGQILAKAAGNPLYLEEIIRSLIDSNIIFYHDGVWTANPRARSLPAADIPDSIQAIILARLDRLDRDARNVLQSASVMGQAFPGPVLERLCGIDDLMLSLHLATLQDYEYITALKPGTAAEYSFRHPLLHETVYKGLLKKKRRELHRQAGEAVEEIYRTRLDDWVEFLALQYARSDTPERALPWLKAAGARARQCYANEAALGHFQEIVTIVRASSPGGPGEPLLCDALEQMGHILHHTGQYEAARTCFEQLLEAAGSDHVVRARCKLMIARISESQGDFRKGASLLDEADALLAAGSSPREVLEKASISIQRSRLLSLRGDYRAAVAESEKALDALKPLARGDDGRPVTVLQGQIYSSLASFHFSLGEYDMVIALLEQSMAIAEKYGLKRSIASTSNNLGIAHTATGNYRKSAELFEKYLKIAEEIGYKIGVGIASNNLAVTYLGWADYDRALELFAKHIRVSEEANLKRSLATTYSYIGQIHQERGEYDQARALFEKDLAITEPMGYQEGIGLALTHLASLAVETSELNEANAHLGKAQKIFEAMNDAQGLIEVYSMRARVLSLQTPGRLNPEALELAQDGLKFAESTRHAANEAKCSLALGRVHAAALAVEEAEPYFLRAIEIFEQIGLRYLFADACGELGALLTRAGLPRADEYLNRALEVFQALHLDHKVKQIRIIRGS